MDIAKKIYSLELRLEDRKEVLLFALAAGCSKEQIRKIQEEILDIQRYILELEAMENNEESGS